jgi:menaquinone-9 beta-reductase
VETRKVDGIVDADVVVVGAGPAGAATAARLGQLGVSGVVLLDKHDSPRDKTCGSGISPKGIEVLRELGVWGEVERASYPIRGLRLVTPGGREAFLSGGASVEAVVCKRRVLDHLLVGRAVSGGARFLPGFDAAALIEEGGRAVGVRARDGRQVRARFVVVAGGTHASGLTPRRGPRMLTQAIMGWWTGVPFRAHHVEMIFDRMLRPMYGWLFPEGDELVNIGITYNDDGRNARALFTAFLEKHFARRLTGARPVGAWKGHPVAASYRISDLTSPGRFVVGESGLMTHPATAEGIYQALRSGSAAAECLAEVLTGRSAESDARNTYERRCRRLFARSFLAAGLFRGLVRTPLLDALVRVGQQPVVRRTAAKLLASM